MSCFIHKKKEGVAVCKQCGKNMCVECSSLVEHTGICPTCYRPILQNEVFVLTEERRDLIGSIISRIFLSVLLCWTFIYPIVSVFKLIKMFERRNDEIPMLIADLEKKIAAIDKALGEGSANI